jgi:hypothetical protein
MTIEKIHEIRNRIPQRLYAKLLWVNINKICRYTLWDKIQYRLYIGERIN